MPIEKQPLYPLPQDYQPAMSVPYPVKGVDSKNRPKNWKTIAEEHNLDVTNLIHFNFHTGNPDEVNWYLRRNVGCHVATKDGLNWTFGGDPIPGKIYLPIERIDFAPKAVTGRKTISPFAKEFEGPSSPLDKIGKVFDGLQLLDIGLTIFGVAVGEVVMLGIAIVTAPFALSVLMGGMHEAALNELRKKQIMEGLGRGIVLAADGRSLKYAYDNGHFKLWPVNDVNYPAYGKQLQGLYNTSLVAGFAHGRDFNEVAKENFWKFIKAQLTDYARAEYEAKPSKSWSDSKWQDWYRLCGKIVERKLKLN